MKISFVLTGRGNKPSGGFKVVYAYANGLARRGYEVTVIHPARLYRDTPVHKYPEKALHYLLRGLDRSYLPDRWFELDRRVNTKWVPSLNSRHIPEGDVIFATGWATAEWVAGYPASAGKPFYLLQHLEVFGVSRERVLATWHLPLGKIVIAKWLQEMAADIGEDAAYIPNGLDFEAFGMDTDALKRSPYNLMMMYHRVDWKGSADGLKALRLVHEQVPNLRVQLFGIESPPGDLPEWIHYYQNPGQDRLRDLYNQAAVFVGPSWTEGWGLPPAEAMMCGCAVAATDNGGHREYAQHDVTALLSPIKDPAALAENILRLIGDESLRLRLAHVGNLYIRRFTWDKALDAFETMLHKEF